MAATRVIEEWGKASQMPPLSFILERCTDYQEVAYTLPPISQIAENSGVSHEQVLEWLEEGKRKQREYYAKLHADPKWLAMMARLRGVEPSNIPPPGPERDKWATKKAKENGWL